MLFDIDPNRLNIKTEFPRPVRVVRHAWIPMSDGARLAARIWLPEDAERDPAPALLEYIPYRKNDVTAMRDSIRHPYFAGHGYASVRVDMRGSGDSEGLLLDEYLQQEQDDALEVIAWLRAQPWCTGAVGMFGKSWGGFNSLQVAALRPPGLKAIVTIDSTADRYANDVHYMGGCLLASDMLWWAAYMLPWNGRPPDPAAVGERWREMWLARLEANTPWVETWMRHQRRDAYWQHGSVCEDYAAIEAATLIVGGWEDGYRSSAFALLENLACPKRAIVGPWSHEYAEVALPGPQIGFLQECLRWWDYWLKGRDTGIMDEPLLRVYLREAGPPATFAAHRPGRWAAEREWPSPRLTPRRLYPSGEALQDAAPKAGGAVACATAQTHGLHGGVWASFGAPGDLPADQRPEDALSTCFTSAPLGETLDLLGAPRISLDLSADKPCALVAVRLCAVASDGASELISYGVLNLTHRESHAEPAALEPGRRYTVAFDLLPLGYTAPAGHRLRLAVAPAYWPRVWPSPAPVTLTLYPGADTFVTLPVRPRHGLDARVSFLPPEAGAPADRVYLREGGRERGVHFDLVRGTATLQDDSDDGHMRLLPDGSEHENVVRLRYTIAEGDPLSAAIRVERRVRIGRGEWQTRVESTSTMRADAGQFHLYNQLTAYEGDTPVFQRAWESTVARDFQ